MNMIKYIRVSNVNDPICVIPPFILGSIPRTMKHVGISLRLYDDKEPDIHHSTTTTLKTVLQNSMFVNPFKALRDHDSEMYEIRLQSIKGDLKKITMESLYNDERIVQLNTNREKQQ